MRRPSSKDNMSYSFPRYLLSKQSVDDRALNKDVLNTLKTNLPQQPLRIIEVGAGIGTMLKRLIQWDVVRQCEYVMVDELAGNIEYASEWVKVWVKEAGFSFGDDVSVEGSGERLHLFGETRDVQIQFEQADVFDFIQKNTQPADLLIAHAFLDLLPMRESLTKILSLTNNLAWLTINFDGVSAFEPTIDAALDEQIEMLYHSTMNSRPTGGDSKSGRHLFGHLRSAGAEILAAGASDWVVHSKNGKYPDDEEYFLNHILLFIEGSLRGHPMLDMKAFDAWHKKRREQIEHGELVYLAHQMDFLARV